MKSSITKKSITKEQKRDILLAILQEPDKPSRYENGVFIPNAYTKTLKELEINKGDIDIKRLMEDMGCEFQRVMYFEGKLYGVQEMFEFIKERSV